MADLILSKRSSGGQCISCCDILTIAIVICIPKRTSISSSVTMIDFPVSCFKCRFVFSERYLRISLSQNLWKNWKWVIFLALGGGGLNVSPLKEVSNKAGSFFLHLLLFTYALLLLSCYSCFVLHSHFYLQSGHHFVLDCCCSHLLQVRPPV